MERGVVTGGVPAGQPSVGRRAAAAARTECDAAHVLWRTAHCNGFDGAPSTGRLPTETALVARTRAFENALTKE